MRDNVLKHILIILSTRKYIIDLIIHIPFETCVCVTFPLNSSTSSKITGFALNTCYRWVYEQMSLKGSTIFKCHDQQLNWSDEDTISRLYDTVASWTMSLITTDSL